MTDRRMIENSSATEQIVNFAANLSIDELPEEVIEKAKLTVLDAIGCAYGGSSSEIGRTAIEALTQEANGKNIVIGSSLKASDIAASFINSTLINALDYDDDNGVGHPTASILPPLLKSRVYALAAASGLLKNDIWRYGALGLTKSLVLP
jgi:2-methylcitrate dehydratase PrpD